MPGPPGFDVVIKDAAGRTVAERRVPNLIGPDVVPSAPVGGTLEARATFLARDSGKYVFHPAATGPFSLALDGKRVAHGWGGTIKNGEKELEAGPHAIEFKVEKGDVEGSTILGKIVPGQTWGVTIVGPDDVVAADPAVVARRLGAHPRFVLRLLSLVPGVGTAVLILVTLLLMGAPGRARWRLYLDALAADPLGPRLAVTLALAALVWPMIYRMFDPGYYACHEGESYIVRFFEYGKAIRAGVPMGRWWDDPVMGRGYPFLCLYAPLLYLVGTPLLLAGISPLWSVKLISAGLIVVGAIAVYRFVRRRATVPSAFAATAVFVYAPYLQTNVWVRADIAESLGFATFPIALSMLDAALDRDCDRPLRAVGLLALAVGALGSCHNITAYFSTYFLALWVLGRVALGTVDKAGFARGVAGGALGFFLTVFYAIPAIYDKERVWIIRVLSGYYDPMHQFVPWSKVPWAEPPWGMRSYIGMAASFACMAGLLGVVLLRRQGPIRARMLNRRGMALISLAGILLVALLATREPLGAWVVQNVPLAKYVQFPWRMYVFAACFAPLCVPVVLDAIASRRARMVLAGTVAVAIVVAHMPVYGPPGVLLRIHLHPEEFLRSLTTDYVTSINEYLPKTVQAQAPYFDPVARALAPTVTLAEPARSPGRYQVRATATVATDVEFNCHWFPGWTATVDDKPVRIGPRGEAAFDLGRTGDGLIRVRVPPGTHEVRLQYRRTPLRLACDLVSLAALALSLILIFARRRGATAESPAAA